MAKKVIVRNLMYALSIFAFFFIWFLWSKSVDNSILAPTPSDTFSSLLMILSQKKTYVIIGYTLLRLLLGLSFSLLVALLLGVLSYVFSMLNHFLKPLSSLLRTIPVASIIVIIIIITNKDLAPHILVFLMLFPLFYEAILGGLKQISMDNALNAYRLDSNLNASVLFKIHLPLLLPYIKTSLIQAIGLGFKVLVMAEFIAQTKYSIGKSIYDAKNQVEFGEVFAWTIILIILVLFIEGSVEFLKYEISKEKRINNTLVRIEEINEVIIEKNLNILLENKVVKNEK